MKHKIVNIIGKVLVEIKDTNQNMVVKINLRNYSKHLLSLTMYGEDFEVIDEFITLFQALTEAKQRYNAIVTNINKDLSVKSFLNTELTYLTSRFDGLKYEFN